MKELAITEENIYSLTQRDSTLSFQRSEERFERHEEDFKWIDYGPVIDGRLLRSILPGMDREQDWQC